MFTLNKLTQHLARNRYKYTIGAIGLTAAKILLPEDEQEPVTLNKNLISQKQINNVPKQKLNIKNLVFRGGGPRGIAYVGALERLEELGLDFNDIERVAGTSAGAITAALISVGYKPKEIKELLDKTKFVEFIHDGDENVNQLVVKLAEAGTSKSRLKAAGRAMAALITNPIYSYKLAKKFYKNKGICSGEKFREWLDEAISIKVAEIEGGNKKDFRHLSFSQLEKLKNDKPKIYKELHVVGAVFDMQGNLDKPSVYSTEDKTQSNYIISDAVRVSMSIPFLFSPHDICYLDAAGNRKTIPRQTNLAAGIDGGVLKNYPIEIFNYNRYLSEPFLNKLQGESIEDNLETLGFDLFDKKNIGFIEWIKRTASAVKNMHSKNSKPLQPSIEKVSRDIMIDTCGVSLFYFNMPQNKIDELKQSGIESVNHYMQNGLMQQLKDCQEKESIAKQKILSDILQSFRMYEKCNLSSNKPSEDYIKSHHISDLKSTLYSNPATCVLVSGIGGLGKSSLVTGYVNHDYLEDILWNNWKKGGLPDQIKKPIIWFLNRNSTDNDAYLTAFSDLYQKLFQAEKSNLSLNDKSSIQSVFYQLEQNPNWLLVFDDCTDFAQIKPFINQSNHGKIIITSRNSELIPTAQLPYKKFPLNKFNNQDCLLLIEKFLSGRNYEYNGFSPGEPDTIITASDGVPLYLKVAITRVYRHKISYINYLKNIKIFETQILSGGDKKLGITTTQKSIILESMAAIQNHPPIDNVDGKLAYKVLELCSYINHKRIPNNLIKLYLQEINPDCIVDEKTIFNIMSIISSTSLITEASYDKVSNDCLYEMHEITQHYIREASQVLDKIKLATNIVQAYLKFPDPVENKNYHAINLYISHLDAIYKNIDIKPKDFTEPLFLGYVSFASLSLESGNAATAKMLFEQAYLICCQQFPEQKKAWAKILSGLGNAWRILGDNNQALDYHKRALNARLQFYGSEQHPEVARSYNNLGIVLRYLGDSKQAVVHHRQALEINRKFYGPEDKEIADCYNHLGVALDNLGDYTQARDYHKRALKIRRKFYGKQHPEVARSYNNLGTALRHLKDYEKAIVYHKRALEIRLNVYGEQHPDTATTYNNLGSAWRSFGDNEQAFVYYKKSLKIRRKIYDNEHHKYIADNLDQLGSVLRNLGNNEQAIDYYIEALNVRRKIYGEEHKVVAKSYNDLGTTCKNLGDFRKAVNYYNQALNINLKLYGKEHEEVARIYNNLERLQVNLQTSNSKVTDSIYPNNGSPHLLFSKNKDALGNQNETLLKEHTFEPTENMLIKAAESGNLFDVCLILQKGADINSQDTGSKKTALHMAVINNHLDVVKFLIENGAKMDIRDAEGKTALEYKDHIEVTYKLTG